MPRNGFRWINWARDIRLKTPQKVTLLVIAAYANVDGEAWPSYETLAEETGLHRATVIRAVRALMVDGYLRRNGRHNGRANVWVLTGSQQPMLMPPEESHRATPVEPKGSQRIPARGRPVLHEGSPSASQNIPRNIPENIQRSPVGDLCRPDGGADEVETARFLGTEKRQHQVAAFIDLGRCLGVNLDGGRVAALLRRYGHGRSLVTALREAVDQKALGPHDYMERILGNGCRGVQEAARHPERRKGSPGERAAAFVARERRG